MDPLILSDSGLLTLLQNPTRILSTAAAAALFTYLAVILAGAAASLAALRHCRRRRRSLPSFPSFSFTDDDDEDDDYSSSSDDEIDHSSDDGDGKDSVASENDADDRSGDFSFGGDVVRTWDGLGLLGLGFDRTAGSNSILDFDAWTWAAAERNDSLAVVRRWRPNFAAEIGGVCCDFGCGGGTAVKRRLSPCWLVD